MTLSYVTKHTYPCQTSVISAPTLVSPCKSGRAILTRGLSNTGLTRN